MGFNMKSGRLHWSKNMINDQLRKADRGLDMYERCIECGMRTSASRDKLCSSCRKM